MSGRALRALAISVAVATVLAIAVLLSLSLGLNGEVQHVVGGLQTHDGGGFFSFIGTFTHRPIAYRFLLALATELNGLLGIAVADMPRFEAGMRLLAILMSAGASLAIWKALGAMSPITCSTQPPVDIHHHFGSSAARSSISASCPCGATGTTSIASPRRGPSSRSSSPIGFAYHGSILPCSNSSPTRSTALPPG